MNRYKSYIFFFFCFLLTNDLFAQGYFEKIFGQKGFDISRSIKQLQSGSLFIAGDSDTSITSNLNFALHKLDLNGNIIFSKYYGGNLTDNCLNMNIDNYQNILMCGETYSSNVNFDGLIIKCDTLGEIIWQKKIGDSLKNESLKYIMKTSDNYILACGFITDAFSSNDFYLVKLDEMGNIIWERTFGNEKNNTGTMCIELSNGNYAIVGDTQGHLNDYDVLIVVSDSNGNELWENSFGNSLQNGSQGIFESSDNNLIVYGETEIFTASPFDFFIQKIDLSGNSLWRKVFGGARTDALFNGLEVNDGFIFTGYTNSYNTGPLNLAIVKSDTSGNFNWIQSYGGNGVDIGYSIIKSKNNTGFYAAGIFTDSTNSQNYLLHFNNDGYLNNEITIKENQFSLFPNPNNGSFTLEGVDFKATISITNFLGELVYFNELISSKLNLNYLNKGVYFVQVNNSKTILSKKIIIQ